MHRAADAVVDSDERWQEAFDAVVDDWHGRRSLMGEGSYTSTATITNLTTTNTTKTATTSNNATTITTTVTTNDTNITNNAT